MNYTSILNPSISIKSLPLKFNLKFFWSLGFILIALLLGLYVFQINALISDTYRVQLHQKSIYELSEGNRILEINSAKLNYLQNLTEKSEALGLERIETINYIHVIDTSVAAKQP